MKKKDAPHVRRPWPRWLQWICGLFGGHRECHHVGDQTHYAYCARCGRMFGWEWKNP